MVFQMVVAGFSENERRRVTFRIRGNLAPIYEPIAWFFKPYKVTIADNILKNGVGAINTEDCKVDDSLPTNLLEFGFAPNEERVHEAQKPLELIEFLIKLTTKENQIVIDPFMGSGSTAVAAKSLKRQFVGFEINKNYCEISLKRLAELELVENKKNRSKEMPLLDTL